MVLDPGPTDPYYGNVRREIVDQVAVGPNTILEIGCANGATGDALRREGRAAWICGVEVMPGPGEHAKRVLDQVFVGDIEALELPFPAGHFDCIILADVLEHLRSPLDQVRRCVRLLKPGGQIIACVPNVRNWRVVAPLLFHGDWKYEDAGILDRTHLRFFTRRSMTRMLSDCGLRTEKCIPLGARSRTLARFGLGVLSELFAVQYLFVAGRSGAPAPPGGQA